MADPHGSLRWALRSSRSAHLLSSVRPRPWAGTAVGWSTFPVDHLTAVDGDASFPRPVVLLTGAGFQHKVRVEHAARDEPGEPITSSRPPETERYRLVPPKGEHGCSQREGERPASPSRRCRRDGSAATVPDRQRPLRSSRIIDEANPFHAFSGGEFGAHHLQPGLEPFDGDLPKAEVLTRGLRRHCSFAEYGPWRTTHWLLGFDLPAPYPAQTWPVYSAKLK